MERDVQDYRMRQLLKSYIEKIRKNNDEDTNIIICLNILDGSHILAPNCKRDQLIEQIVSQAKNHFKARARGKAERTITGDILSDLSGINGRRTAYGTLVQDSRGR
jgi:hypothetical protein